ncbi:TPA: hypothetical protein U2I11_001586 [Citrobacter koseri]|uniref:Eae-like domain protein n=1 Tax=Citrobacter koseri TaxID=545 RepID=A0AAQ0V7K6_CITKO|nr:MULTISPECIES: hypothetical protein [Citrobacter]OFV14072.1 hypothetical protein HMPREF3126_09465 [Salmonella sp. HMSC13B08]DAK07647.1 MAG TPA: hypothetical protein [Caudoviricetes sp.]ASE84364.1 hypothetical protein CEP66_18390 [Citrobacter koseri]ATF97731.1 hypothetical protein CO700_12075 [Citrobacter koseri]AVE68949.1 hypothetical protein AM351_14560 [Citrobacter koseri]
MKSTVETKISELMKLGHELAKELHCAESAALVSDLASQLEVQLVRSNALAAENAGLKQIVDSVTDFSNEPQYHAEGMGCGLEDRGITGRYDACRYGWDEAMERIYGEVIPCAEEIAFPETSAFLAEVRSKSREEGAYFVANRMLAAWDAGFIDDTAKNAADIARMILTSTGFMADAPEGDFDRSFADGVLEDIAAQLRKGAAQ